MYLSYRSEIDQGLFAMLSKHQSKIDDWAGCGESIAGIRCRSIWYSEDEKDQGGFLDERLHLLLTGRHFVENKA